MQNFLSLGYMLHVLLAVSANFPDNPRTTVSSDIAFNQSCQKDNIARWQQPYVTCVTSNNK